LGSKACPHGYQGEESKLAQTNVHDSHPAKESREAKRKVMFVSVGHSPRADLIETMLSSLDLSIEALEIGALDRLSIEEIDQFRPRPGEPGIVTRLRDGGDIVLSKPRIAERMAGIVAGFHPHEFDLVVILSTGIFREFESTCPTVNAQRAMESTIISLASQGEAIGIIQPLEQQVAELDIPALGLFRVTATHAHDGDRGSLARALVDLAECDIIVLNSVSFTEADQQMVAKASGKPVVLARRIVAGAIRLLLSQAQAATLPDVHAEFSERLMRLTPREKQVLSLVAEGLSNKAVARQLGISPKTVEIHRANVMSKMEVTSVGALIRLVVSAGFF
jgi:DNA-binding CsgD family transcriptional regulator